MALGIVLLLFLTALWRFIWPQVMAYDPRRILFEMAVAMLAFSVLALQRTLPSINLSWLIALAGVFLLPLEAGAALASAIAIVTLQFLLRVKLDISLSDWMPHLYATLFVSLLSRLLGRALKQNALALEKAHLDQRRFDAVARATRHGLMIVDPKYMVTYVNPAIREIIGFSDQELYQMTLRDSLHPDDDLKGRDKLRYLRHTPRSTIFSRHRTRHKDGHWVWVEVCGYNLLHDPAIKGLVFSIEDISERKEYELRLEQQALHDPLTGLPNRRHVLKKLTGAIDAFREKQSRLAVFVCNLDFFKSLNDIHGHEFGDKCLLELARRIAAELAPADFLARLGGNEFVVLADSTPQEATVKAEALLAAVARQMVLDNVVVKLQASIGIAFLHAGHGNPSDLLRDADAAMYQAKECGRNRVEVFDAELQNLRTRSAQLEAALHFALERDELSLSYQPKVALADSTIRGFELLLRWNNPQHGEIAPHEFIPIAEASGLIVPVGLWALEQACRQAASWRQQPETEGITIAVNVSMRQLLQSSFPAEVAAILERTGALPAAIELEITESSAMANPLQTVETLTMLKSMGFRLALDDFGTGYSSLAYLQKLPLDVLKIDKAFIHALAKNPGDAEIVRLILALAAALKLDTVAEGVETAEQANLLEIMGCNMGQGYAFSRSVSAQEAERLLRPAQSIALAF
ncbi:EAL domain-containing protein [Janthinobacterium sp. 17J80-10]|nr:EAL domain-containing protein [Janthinobacterium sp. 17J80-10]